VKALGLHEMLPASLLDGRWIAVLTCYLDDSGKDPQNLVTLIAGYIARDLAWKAYEEAVEPIFEQYGVTILHAKELHDTDGDFAGWPIIKKQSFVAKLCLARSPHLMMGMAMAVVKEKYDEQAKKSKRKKTIRPYTFCFNVIIDWIMRDIRIGKAANTEGVALVLECGHENNPEAEETFYKVRKQHDIENVLRSLSFVPKESCRAIQLADLLAFYARRDSGALIKARKTDKARYPTEVMMKIIAEGLPHRSLVATGFGDEVSDAPFFPFGKPLS
jgi:Protein of unknown function (DUF3800)